MSRPDVSVVVPYYDDQTRLTLLLLALEQQRCEVSFEVVVADDGSPRPPVIPAGLSVATTVVHQPDNGFRAAAARNLGAGAAAGELLLFLDGDTLPAARYVQAMADRLRATGDGHGALVVGRRRHADLGSAGVDASLAFLRGDHEPESTRPVRGVVGGVRLLEDPRWLRDGYARTDNLRAATDEDFRLVISAVLGVDRRLWDSVGGFDETFVGYGGEDWDFGWRAWLSGARWCHEPAAVAWHDGPDAAGRGVDPMTKNAECLRLAETIPLPSVRGSGLILHQPETVVRYLGPTTDTAGDAAVVACVEGLLRHADAAVWFPGCVTPMDLPRLLRDDPRVHAGDVPPATLARARYQVWIERPVRLPAPLGECCASGEWDLSGMVRIRRTRTVSRGDRIPTRLPGRSSAVDTPAVDTPAVEPPAVQVIPDDVSLERWWAGW